MKTQNTKELMDVNRVIDGESIDQLFNNNVKAEILREENYTQYKYPNNTSKGILKSLVLTGDTEHLEYVFDDLKNTHFSHFDSYDEIRVPNKIRAAISRDCEKIKRNTSRCRGSKRACFNHSF